MHIDDIDDIDEEICNYFYQYLFYKIFELL